MRNRPPRALDWLAALLLVGGIAAGGGARAAEARDGTVVRDLYYGEVLFQFYKQDDFAALTHLLAARDAGRVGHHEAESELLLGGLYLSYGQHDRAAGIFERLLADAPEPAVRDRAWFYLGKVRYQRGLHAQALEAFARIGPDLPEALAVELPMLVAQSHMAAGDFDGAQRVLASWDAPEGWVAYARYNLGVALVRLGRTEEGAQLLDRVGRLDAATAEERDLRDKANLALGYAFLQANAAAAARPVLERVRLRGPFASKALLGVGWADAAAGDYGAALVPWLELVDRDLMDSAVQESFLAVPYALGRLEAHGTAVERYQRALATFDGEIDRLGSAVGRARSGALLPALLEDDDAGLGRWYWRMKKVPDGDDSRYLYHLMADNAFQEGFKNYRDLTLLDRHLEDWRQRLDTFAGMVEARPPKAARRASTMPALEARRAALAARLERAERERDVAALADGAEADQWSRLLAVEADPRFAGADEDLRHRHRLLKGVLAWELDRRFRERAWLERRALAAVDRDIAVAAGRLGSIRAAQAGEPRRFDEFAARIAALTPPTAVRELDAQRERLASYRVQARFALAAIYDRAGASQAAAAGAGAP